MTEEQATKIAGEFCRSYIAAFESGDVSRVSDHWTFPAVISTHGAQHVFASKDAFDRNTSRLLGFYEDQRMARVEREVETVIDVSDDTVFMRVKDKMFDPEGKLIVDWQTGYMLVRTSDGFKALSAAAEGEVDAWTARGTPMGSKRGTP